MSWVEKDGRRIVQGGEMMIGELSWVEKRMRGELSMVGKRLEGKCPEGDLSGYWYKTHYHYLPGSIKR